MSLQVSVIIPTHNPRLDYLKRTLEALAAQTLDRSSWELVVVDNNSEESLERELNPALARMGWATAAQSGAGNGRVVREEKLGLTNARLNGITNSSGKYLCFVDDDNLLDSRYLQNACEILDQRPNIGVIGGHYRAEFEEEPPEYATPYLKLLCVTEKPFQDAFSFDIKEFPDIAGAGMVITRECALHYKKELEKNSIGLSCDRKGSNLISGGDTHICYCVLRNGFGIGKVNALNLTHLISKERLSKAYLLRMSQDMSYSFFLVNQINGIQNPFKILEYLIGILSSFLKTPFDGAMRRARIYGALKFWAEKLFFVKRIPFDFL